MESVSGSPPLVGAGPLHYLIRKLIKDEFIIKNIYTGAVKPQTVRLPKNDAPRFLLRFCRDSIVYFGFSYDRSIECRFTSP